jgi:hypothetical protein
VELRFDTEESEGYLLSFINVASLIAAVGGSSTDANYAFATATPNVGREQITQAGRDIVGRIRTSTTLRYRLRLGEPADGKQGTFDLPGFARFDANAGWKCGKGRRGRVVR